MCSRLLRRHGEISSHIFIADFLCDCGALSDENGHGASSPCFAPNCALRLPLCTANNELRGVSKPDYDLHASISLGNAPSFEPFPFFQLSTIRQHASSSPACMFQRWYTQRCPVSTTTSCRYFYLGSHVVHPFNVPSSAGVPSMLAVQPRHYTASTSALRGMDMSGRRVQCRFD